MESCLTAILAADMVGYSRLIRANKEGSLLALKALRTICAAPGCLVRPVIEARLGPILDPC